MSRIDEIQNEMLRLENILSDKLKKWGRSTGEVYADLEWALETIDDMMSVVVAAIDHAAPGIYGSGHWEALQKAVIKFQETNLNRRD